MAKIVIIGAGLTGISTAYHLEQKGFFDYCIVEKEKTIGGLCRSITQDGFTFDFTGHLLHASDTYFRTLIDKVVGTHNFNAITRRSFIYSQNTYTNYPYQINLHGLPTATIAECLEGFIRRPTNSNDPKTFYQWVMKNFGAGFGKHFFFDYQKKIFAYDIRKITASWTGRFVPSTSLEQIIEGIIGAKKDQEIGYNSQFLYPKQGGIISWVEKLAQQLSNPIATDFCVKTINMHQKVIHFTNGHVEPFDQLINTMPLDRLLGCLQEKSSTHFATAKNRLLCNTVVNFNLGISDPNLSTKHWVYYPETQYPFYRIGFPHNFAESMAPKNCSSLYGEFSYVKKSKNYANNLLKESLRATKKLFGITEEQIITEKIITIPHAYVIYDFWRERNLPDMLNKLKEHNIHSVGRYGEWKYSSMQEAVLDGKKIAESLICTPSTSTTFTTHARRPSTQQGIIS